VRCNVAARLILTRLKLDDLLDAELMRLQQQEMKYQRMMTLSGSVSSSSVIAGSYTAVSQPTSTPASQSISASSSQPFELPDVDISDLLNATVHSLNDVRSSLAGCQPNSLLSASSQRLSSTDRDSKKKAGNRKKGGENCRQNSARKSDHNLTANDKKPSVTKTLTAGDSRKRRNSLAVDSDDEFEDSWFSSATKKQVQEMRQDDQKADCGSSTAAAAGEVVDKTDDKSCNYQDESGIVTDITCHKSDVSCTLQSQSPITLSGRSQQRTVAAQRLSKFAFNDRLLRQRQQSPTSSRVTSVKSQSPAGTDQTLQHGTGDCYFVALSVCVHSTSIAWICIMQYS